MPSVAYIATPAVVASTQKAQDMMMAVTPTSIAPAVMPTQAPTGGGACPTKAEPTAPPANKGAKRARNQSKTSPSESPQPTAVPGSDTAVCEEKTPDSGTWLIVAKAVRMHLKNHEHSMHCGSDALPALNAKLADMIRDAMNRAHLNGRKTLKACDF